MTAFNINIFALCLFAYISIGVIISIVVYYLDYPDNNFDIIDETNKLPEYFTPVDFT